MKFEQQLECLALPKFRGYYLNYKALKKAVDVFTGQERDQSTVQEVTHWTSSFLRLGPNPEVPPEAKLREILGHELERVSKFADIEATAIRTQLDKLEADATRGQGGDQEALLKSLDMIGDQIVDLKGFALLNFTGFRKILKKYDKWSKSSVLPWFMAMVVKAPLMSIDFDAFIQSLNRCAMAIGIRKSSGPSTATTMNGNLTFLVDPQDAMRARIALAKNLIIAPGSQAPRGPAERRPRTSAVYFDTPDLSVYSAHVVGVPGSDSEASNAAAKAPCDSVHVRYDKGDTTTLIHEAKGSTTPTLVALSKAQVAALFKGEAQRVSDARASAALTQVAESVQANGLRPVTMASYSRTAFADQGNEMSVVFEEDIKLSKMPAAAAWDSAPSQSEHFPYSLLTITITPGVAMPVMPKWLADLCEITTLLQVSGFMLGLHAEARFRARGSGLPMPHWYRNVMNAEDVAGEGASDTTEQQKSSLDAAVPSVSRPSPVYDFGGAARLLHEFGTAPEVESAMASRRSMQSVEFAPAPDTGSLSAPLLGGTSGGMADEEKKALAAKQAAKPVRNAIVAVQPKTLFSNERTFLDWIHFAVMYAALGIALTQAASRSSGVILGRCLVLFSICIVLWSLRMFNRRADALDGKVIMDYSDPIGPPLFMAGLFITLICSTLHAVHVV